MKKLKRYAPLILNILIIVIPFGLLVTWTYRSIAPVGEIHGLYISLSGIISFLFAILSLGIHIIIHEFGHLVTGLISGYRFGFFRIWKYALVHEDDKFKIKNFHIPGSLGQCLMFPPEKIDEDFPFLLYNLGGIVFNGIFSAIGFILTFILPINLLGAFFLSFGFIGLYLAVVNGYPFEFIPNDGTNLKSMKRSPDSKKAFYNALLLTKMYMEENPDINEIKSLISKENYQDFNEPLVQNITSENISIYIEEGELKKALNFTKFLLGQKNMTSILKNLLLIDKGSIDLLLGNFSEIAKLDNNKVFQAYIKAKGQSEIERYKYMYYTLYKKDEEKAKKAFKNVKSLSEDHLFNSYGNNDKKFINWTIKKSKWIERLEVLDSVDSTNDYLKEKLHEGNYDKDFVIAYRQTSGKGQGSNTFYSPTGGMYLSVALKPDYNTSQLKYLTGRAGVATVKAIKKALGKKANIKWINDIIFKDKKVGGILTESKLDSHGNIEYIVIGIGLNLKDEGNVPEDISEIYGTLEENNIEDVSNSILYYLIPELQKLEEEVNLEIFVKEYNTYLYRKNQFNYVRRKDEILEVILTGIDENMDIITEMDGKSQTFSYIDSKIVSANVFSKIEGNSDNFSEITE